MPSRVMMLGPGHERLLAQCWGKTWGWGASMVINIALGHIPLSHDGSDGETEALTSISEDGDVFKGCGCLRWFAIVERTVA